MSRADEIFQQNCRDILENGVWDTDQNVRPHWEDGTPAHTVKKFGIINRYDLRQEFPILTIRRTYFKTCIDELLWIWQKKSNNIHDLRGHIWDSWADENGSIGKAYGYQLGVKHQYPEGAFDQVDRVLYDLRHNPASRRIMTNLYNFQDLHEMALYPCAYSMTFNVSGRTLNAILNQRSQDMLTANNWNVAQYAVLVHMMAQASGLEAGELVHVIADAHIYDRHVPLVRQLLERQGRTRGAAKSAYYSTRPSRDAAEGAALVPTAPSRGGRRRSAGQDAERPGFRAQLKALLLAAVDLLRHSTVNQFEVWRHGEMMTSLPVLILILLILVAFWISVPLLLLGLFFGCRYRFSGPDLEKSGAGDAVNRVTGVVGDAVEQVKDAFTRAAQGKDDPKK